MLAGLETPTKFYGAESTIKAARSGIRACHGSQTIRGLVEDICEDLDGKDYLSEILAVYHYVCDHTRYMRDPVGQERVPNPILVVDQINRGHRPSIDCEDYAGVLAALCMALGCQAQLVTANFAPLMSADGRVQYTHMFMAAQEPLTRRWIVLDPVARNASQMLQRIHTAKVWPI